MKRARLNKRDKDSLTITMDGLNLRTSGTDLPNHVILLVNDGRDEVHYSLDNACRESSGCVMKKTQPVPHIQSWQSLRDIQTAHLQHGAVLLDKTTDKHTYWLVTEAGPSLFALTPVDADGVPNLSYQRIVSRPIGQSDPEISVPSDMTIIAILDNIRLG